MKKDNARIQMKALRDRRLVEGKCPECGGEHDRKPKWLCSKCCEYQRRWGKETTRKRAKCRQCGGGRFKGKTFCEKCYWERKVSQEEKQRKHLAEGRSICGG